MESVPIQPLPVVMTIEGVAQLLQCDVSTVNRYVHAHELRAIQIGREKRILGVDLWHFLCARPSTVELHGG